MSSDRGTGLVSREFGSWSAWVVWILRLALGGLVYATTEGILSPDSALVRVSLRDPVRVIAILGAAGALASLVLAVLDTEHPALLKRVEALAYVLLVAYGGAIAFGLFAHYRGLDHVIHFLAGVTLVYAAHAFAVARDVRWLWRFGSRAETGVHAFGLVMALTVAWEFFEIGVDAVAGTHLVGRYPDTSLDLAGDALGALVGATVAALALNEAPLVTRIRRRRKRRRESRSPA